MGYLVLVRHGQSLWNLMNRFTGWVDVPLSDKGIKEALSSGKKLEKIDFDVAFTSTLSRAQETLLLILSKQKRVGRFIHGKGKLSDWSHFSKKKGEKQIPIHYNSALNERYYGAIQGMDKDVARKKYGKDKVHLWRRSFEVSPPKGESLKDTMKRAVPYFNNEIMPELKKGRNVIVSAHGNSLRGIVKHIDGISDFDIPHLEIPTGKPRIYRYTKKGLSLEKI